MNTDATTDRVQAFVEEALRWLPDVSASGVGSSGSAPGQSEQANPSVLLVEDNADMRDYLHDLLKDSYNVTAVANGQAALDSIRHERPDLVLSDVMMPVLNGFKLLAAIRGDPELRDIPVVLLSARAGEEDQIEGLDTGADDYVTKPFSAHGLRARVRANLSLARMRREAVLTMAENDRKLQRLNEDLEERIQREVQMHRTALVRLTRAEKTSALGQLAGGMAHDFNNVLQVVSGYGSLIQLKSTDAAVTRMASVIEEAARRGQSVTKRLLVFARQDRLQPEAVDLSSLFDGIRDVLAHTLGTHVTVAFDVLVGLPSVMADRSQLETVLINLAINAGDAMPEGGTLTISARPEVMTDPSVDDRLSAGAYIRLSVRDTGSGMDATTLARVTEPFYTTKPVGRGTGLGLSMASSFAEQSEGALTIVSAPGQGTTVSLLLPSTEASTSATPNEREDLGEARDAGPSILVVDDEILVRDVIVAFLEDAGYSVTQADGAAAALDVLRSGEKIDLLLSDLSMPGLDGISLIRAAQNHRPSLPAVLLTGYAGDVSSVALGCSFTLLHKPINKLQLARQVASSLQMADALSDALQLTPANDAVIAQSA